MGQYEIVVGVEQRQLMLQAVFALAQRINPTSYCCHALPDVQVQPFYKRGIDLAAQRSQHCIDGLQRAKDDPVCHADQTPTSILLDDLRVEQPRQRPPAWLGPRAFLLAACRVNPAAEMAQDGGQIALEAITQTEGVQCGAKRCAT